MAIYLNKFGIAIRAEHILFNLNLQTLYWVYDSVAALLLQKTVTLDPSLESTAFIEYVDPSSVSMRCTRFPFLFR